MFLFGTRFHASTAWWANALGALTNLTLFALNAKKKLLIICQRHRSSSWQLKLRTLTFHPSIFQRLRHQIPFKFWNISFGISRISSSQGSESKSFLRFAARSLGYYEIVIGRYPRVLIRRGPIYTRWLTGALIADCRSTWRWLIWALRFLSYLELKAQCGQLNDGAFPHS